MDSTRKSKVITVTAIGRLGRNAELRVVGATTVCSFALAVDKQKKKDELKAGTDWYSCEIWGKRGEALMPYLMVANKVAVSGRQEQQTFQKTDGTPGFKVVINVNDIDLLSPAPAQAPPAPPKPATPPPAPTNFDEIFASDDEIPF